MQASDLTEAARQGAEEMSSHIEDNVIRELDVVGFISVDRFGEWQEGEVACMISLLVGQLGRDGESILGEL
jgi:hypothetical protein